MSVCECVCERFGGLELGNLQREALSKSQRSLHIRIRMPRTTRRALKVAAITVATEHAISAVHVCVCVRARARVRSPHISNSPVFALAAPQLHTCAYAASYVCVCCLIRKRHCSRAHVIHTRARARTDACMRRTVHTYAYAAAYVIRKRARTDACTLYTDTCMLYTSTYHIHEGG